MGVQWGSVSSDSTKQLEIPSATGWIHRCRNSLDMVDQPYYTILHKGLGHPWILVSVAGPGTNPTWIQRDKCISQSCFLKKPTKCPCVHPTPSVLPPLPLPYRRHMPVIRLFQPPARLSALPCWAEETRGSLTIRHKCNARKSTGSPALKNLT